MVRVLRKFNFSLQMQLTHGFDDKGRLFDKDGNLNKWWSDFSIKHFHDKTKCLIQQYNKYTLTDIGQTIDGETTQGNDLTWGKYSKH